MKTRQHRTLPRKILSVLMTVLLTVSVIGPTLGALTVPAEAAGLSLAQLQAKYPHGMYWNGGNPDAVTGSPCRCRHNATHKSGSAAIACECNKFDGAIQCHGFALKLGYDAFGTSPKKWRQTTDRSYVDSLKPGDVVTWSSPYDHTVFVTSVNSTRIAIGECNSGGPCLIKWTGTVDKSVLKGRSGLRIYIAPDTLSTGDPAPAPVTPEIMLSQSAVSLAVGQKATIAISIKSPVTCYLTYTSSMDGVLSKSWGSWNSAGNQRPLSITGVHAGSTTVTITMYDAATNQVLASKSFPVTVSLAARPAVTFSPSSVTLEEGASTTVYADIAWNGAPRIRWDVSNTAVCSGELEKPTNTRREILLTGLRAGSSSVTATFRDANGKDLCVYLLPVLVKQPVPASVKLDRTSLTMEKGQQTSIPIDFNCGSKSATLSYTVGDPGVCLCNLQIPVAGAGTAMLNVSALKAGTTKVLVEMRDAGGTALASDVIAVTVKEPDPLTVSVSPASMTLGVGETKEIDITWKGKAPSGSFRVLAKAETASGYTTDAIAMKAGLLSSGGAVRVAVTGVKEGTCRTNISLCDSSGKALTSTQFTATVINTKEPAKITTGTWDQILSIERGQARMVSFDLSGDFADVTYNCTSNLSVKVLRQTDRQLVLIVTAEGAGVGAVSASLVDENGTVLDSAHYSMEIYQTIAVVPANPDPAEPGSSNTTTTVVSRPEWDTPTAAVTGDTGGTGTDHVVSGTITGTLVRNSAGPVLLDISIEEPASITGQSTAAVQLPANMTASGSVEITGGEGAAASANQGAAAPAGGGSLAGDEVVSDGGSESAPSPVISSDGKVVEGVLDGGMRFTDVSSGKYYYDAVRWAVSNGVTDGISGTALAPDGACPRGQVVEFMWRAMGCPAPASGENPFTDLSPSDSWYQAALWAYGAGITTGSTATTFSPDSTCTRGQVVTFLWRAEGKPAASGGGAFSDVPDGAYFADSVRWAVARGVTKGTTDTTFSPGSTCTRGQILTFLCRGMAQ